MKKRLLSLLLVASMATAMLVGCGQEEKPVNTETSKTTTETGTASGSVATEEPPVAYEDLPTINILYSHGDDCENSENWKEVAMRIGAKVHFIGADTDKFNTMIAGGEGYDIVMASKNNMVDLATGGGLLALDDLVAEYENITTNAATFIKYSKETYSDGTGALYWLPAGLRHTGETAGSKDASHGMIRWDLYAKMGYPETNSMDEFIEMIADMQAANPTTADGKKVYGMTIPSDKLMWTFQYPFKTWAGLTNHQKTGSYYWSDMSYVNDFSEEGIFWDAIDFYHKVYKLGLLDPDAFAITEADMKVKASEGRLLFIGANYQTGTMAEGQGFSAVPVTWACSDTAAYSVSSEITTDAGFAVNKNSENVELCMKYLDFVFSEEGANLIYNGLEDVYYTTDANGVRSLTEEGLALYKDADAWTKAGLGTTSSSHFVGLYRGALGSDGKTMLLGLDPEYFQDTLTATQKDFCEHYGVDYPSLAFAQNAEKNNLPEVVDISGMIRNFLPTPTDEIAQLEAAVIAEAEGLIASLVMADDAKYEALVADAKARLAKVGVTKITEYYESVWNTAIEKAKEYE